MTREEAIEVIKDIYNYTKWDTYTANEARTMAIIALEQEPCPNAISRSDMLDAVGHGMTYTSEDLQKIIKGLPPVNPLAKDYNTIYYTPQPKTGHWQHYEGMLICSECRTEFYDDIMEYCGDDAPKWCPDCGTKMIEPQESEG